MRQKWKITFALVLLSGIIGPSSHADNSATEDSESVNIYYPDGNFPVGGNLTLIDFYRYEVDFRLKSLKE
jgi:hypothetical protein